MNFIPKGYGALRIDPLKEGLVGKVSFQKPGLAKTWEAFLPGLVLQYVLGQISFFSSTIAKHDVVMGQKGYLKISKHSYLFGQFGKVWIRPKKPPRRWKSNDNVEFNHV